MNFHNNLILTGLLRFQQLKKKAPLMKQQSPAMTTILFSVFCFSITINVRSFAFDTDSRLMDALEYSDKKNTEDLIAQGIGINYQDVDGNTPLHSATEVTGHRWQDDVRLPILESLLKKGANPNVVNKNGEPPLWGAVHYATPLSVKALLAAGADPNIKFDRYGVLAHPLFYLLSTNPNGAGVNYRNFTEVAVALIEGGSDVNLVVGPKKESPLTAVCSNDLPYANGHQIVKSLVKAGADIKRDGLRCLETASQFREDYKGARVHYVEIAEEMLNLGVDPNPSFPKLITRVFTLKDLVRLNLDRNTSEKIASLVRLYVNKGADTSVLPSEKIPALIADVIGNRIDSVRDRIEAGENLYVTEGYSNLNALMVAALLGRVEIAKLLIKAGMNIYSKASLGKTGSIVLETDAFAIAAFFSRDGVLPLLDKAAPTVLSLLSIEAAIQVGADDIVRQHIVSGKKYPALLSVAAASQQLNALKLLIAGGVDPKGKGGDLALAAAIEACRDDETPCLPLVEALLDGGANPNAVTYTISSPETPVVSVAASKYFTKIVKLFLDKGADLNPKFTFHLALWNPYDDPWGYLKLTKFFIEMGINPNSFTNQMPDTAYYGENIVIVAACSRLVELSQFISEHGGDLKSMDSKGNSVLTCREDGPPTESVARYLISRGANVNHRNKKGETPLMFAVTRMWAMGYIDLIAAGADVNAVDNAGNSVLKKAIQYCGQNKDCHTVKALKAAGAH